MWPIRKRQRLWLCDTLGGWLNSCFFPRGGQVSRPHVTPYWAPTVSFLWKWCWDFSSYVHPCKWHGMCWKHVCHPSSTWWRWSFACSPCFSSVSLISGSSALTFDLVMQWRGYPNPSWHPVPLPCTYLSCNYPLTCVASLLICGYHTRL